MSIVTIWNKASSNYGKNDFVKRNGTSEFEVENEIDEFKLLLRAIQNPDIERVDIELENGTIFWLRDHKHNDDVCLCNDCIESFEEIETDDEDEDDDDEDYNLGFDLNDPRR